MLHSYLRILRSLLNVVGNDRDVLKVEGRIDLIHKVERRRLKVMQCKHQRQRAQGLRRATRVSVARTVPATQ